MKIKNAIFAQRLDWTKWHNCYNFSILECPGIIKNKFTSHTMMRASQNMQSLTENWEYTWCRLSRHWWNRRLSLLQPPVPRVTKMVTPPCRLWRRNSNITTCRNKTNEMLSQELVLNCTRSLITRRCTYGVVSKSDKIASFNHGEPITIYAD